MHREPNPAARRALDTIAWAAMFAGCLALAGMAAVQAWQVFARYVLNDSPGWTEPVALLLLNTVMMLGAAIGVRTGQPFPLRHGGAADAAVESALGSRLDELP